VTGHTVRFRTLLCSPANSADHPFRRREVCFCSSEQHPNQSGLLTHLRTPANFGVALATHRSCYTVAPMTRQRFGQHFLTDPGWRSKIARAIGLDSSPAETPWLEIGAGHGEMTRLLAATGVPVFAVELDPALQRRLGMLAAEHPNLRVVPGDILDLDLAAALPAGPVRAYGNLPYYITSPVLHRLYEFAGRLEVIHIVIQLEVALRLAAHPGSRAYGYLSVATQYFTRPEIVLRIPRMAFRPPPKVTSALVTMRFPGERARLDVRDEPRFFDFVKLAFAQKRKTLVNNLRSLAAPVISSAALAHLGLRPDARAEQLSVAQFADLFRHLNPD
jgi:16S rRNA (adenine1518-N6/adenine1519-N6)-dimethyltransferase